MKGHRPLSIALALAGMLAAGGVNAQYAEELGKLAPEALKGGTKPQPAQLKEIAPGLYFFRNDGSSNALFMVTDEGVMVVDAQQHPADMRRLLGIIRKITDKPVKWVVVTRAHGDHFLGKPMASYP